VPLPGQRVRVDTIALRVPGQKPTQVSGLRAGHPEHQMPAGGEEHRHRQPRRPGRLHHHLQHRAHRCPGQRRRLHPSQTAHRRLAPPPAHLPPALNEHPHRVRARDPQIHPDQSSDHPDLHSSADTRTPAGPRTVRRQLDDHGPKGVASNLNTAPTHVLQPGPTSLGRPTSLIRGIRGQASSGSVERGHRRRQPSRRPSLRATLNATPPNQPGCSCNPGTPGRSRPEPLT